MKKALWILQIAAFFILPVYTYLLRQDFLTRYHRIASVADPDWSYLANSLLVAEGKTPQHVDHPGTPLQILGAIVYRVNYLFSSREISLAEDVFTRPEHYLELGSLAEFFLAMLALAIGAILFFHLRAGFFVAILAQAIFLSFPQTVLEEFLRFKPDLLIGALGFFFVAFVAYAREKKRFAALAGMFFGIGVALKFNFAPFVVAALFLPKQKMRFFGGAIFAWVLSCWPMRTEYGKFFHFLWSVLTKDGSYGGKPELFDVARMAHDFLRIFSVEPVLLPYLVAVSLAVLLLWCYRQKSPTWQLCFFPVLVIALNLLMVAKHPSSKEGLAERYLLPSFACLAAFIPLAMSAARGVLSPLFFTCFVGLFVWTQNFPDVFFRKIDIAALGEKPKFYTNSESLFAEKKNCSFIFQSYPATKLANIRFANQWSRGEYAPILEKLYPLRQSYQVHSGALRNFLEEKKSFELVAEELRQGACYLILTMEPRQESPAEYDALYWFRYKDITAKNEDLLYDGRSPVERKLRLLQVTGLVSTARKRE
jgi:hypothetical protein